jgi:predicted O-methyltransferase YrrM
MSSVKPGGIVYTGYRLYKAFLVTNKYAKKVFGKAIRSKETSTFTYNLTPENETYLANLTAEIVKCDVKTIEQYFNELKENEALKKSVIRNVRKSAFKMKKDKRSDYGSKLSFYAIIRVLKPKIVVENGIEVGFTSIVLCEAIRKNREEGHGGRFIGLDINKEAGYLIKAEPQYGSFSEIWYNDAIESLKALNENIDFYFSDGLRTYQYEQQEFACIEGKLSKGAVVITNKATFSRALYELSLRLKRKFAFFKEQPLDHWYEGSGIGIMYL